MNRRSHPTIIASKWAIAGESYTTWSDSDGNAFPAGESYTITGLDSGETYNVRVRARYSSEPPGPWSDEAEADVMAETPTPTATPTSTATDTPTPTPTPSPIPPSATALPLGKPTNLTAVQNGSGITLSWAAPAGQVDGYEILRRRRDLGESLQTYVADTGSNATTYTDTSITHASRHTYRVKAIRDGVKSQRSNFARVDVEPTATTIPPTDTPVPPTDTPIPTATPIPPTDTPIPSATPIPPTDTPIPTATPLPPLERPQNLTASVVANGITLNWDAPTGQVDGYEILRRRPHMGEDELQILVADTGSNATTYTDATATESTRYVYRVKAIRNGERSQRSKFARVDR